MSEEDVAAAWQALVERKDPLSPPPDRYGFAPEGFRGKATVYVGHYPADAFPSRAAFQAFCWYTASAQQAILSDGPTPAALEWFVPDDDLPERLVADAARPAADEREVWRHLERLVLPDDLSWVKDVTLVDAVLDAYDEELSVTAQTDDGWLQLFTVDDGGLQ